jgi:hypothetical protein
MERIIILPMVSHILELARNLISVSKMSDVGVHTVFENETYKMVQEAVVLMRGFLNETIYKMLRRTIIDGYNNYFVT